MIFHSLTLEKMEALAAQVALRLYPGVSLCFYGDLGAGKTTFARNVLKTLDSSLEEIPSPTFTLVQQYSTPVGQVWHCDFYRLKNADEVFELGMEEAFHSEICLIEWPEKIHPYLPQNRVEIHIKICPNMTREISLTRRGDVRDTFLDIHI